MAKKDLQQQWREWLERKLAERGRGTKGKLSRHLQIHQNAITNILKAPSMRGYRAIKAEELVKIAEFFGEAPPCLSEGGISPGHNELVAVFKQIPPEQQRAVLTLLESLAAEKRKK